MPSTRKPSTAKSAKTDAVSLLTDDHKQVDALFKQYEKLMEDESADDEAKRDLATQICDMLTVHATIEEEIFYPAARDALEDQDLLDEAEVEHASAKDLIAQIEGMDPDEELYDAKVTVLGEYIRHHVKEEQDELFPLCKKAKELDLQALGEQLSQRRHEMLAELGYEEEQQAS